MGNRTDASTAASAEGPNQRSTTEILWLGAAAGVCCCWLLLRRRGVYSALLQCLSSCGQLRCVLSRLRHQRSSPTLWKTRPSRGNASSSSEDGSESDADEDEYSIYASSLDYKMVLCVRQDLGMTKGKIAAQCGHATLGAYLRAKKRCSPDCLKLWEASGQKKIAVKVKDETELEHLEWEAHKKGVNAYAVHDALLEKPLTLSPDTLNCCSRTPLSNEGKKVGRGKNVAAVLMC